MGINIQTFKIRTITSVIFVLVMLAGLFVNSWGFIAMFTIIMFGCLYELSKIVKKIDRKKYFLFTPLAFFYIIMPLIMMMDLGINGTSMALDTNIYSPLFPCAIIFSLWINDTMAYLVGSFIGKTPLTKISPKKTWEGTIGGAVLCVAVIGLLSYYIPPAKNIAAKQWIIVAAICAVFGILGDLFESKLKRMANIKDTGNFLPGHGGFLDRFDSLLVATPFVWCYIKFFL